MPSFQWQEGEWRVLTDGKSKHSYFHNVKTGEVTWIPPSAIVSASRRRSVVYDTQQWQVLTDSRQKPYYYNRKEHSSVWDAPAGLSERHAEAQKYGRQLLQAVAGLVALKIAEEEGDGSNIPEDTTPKVNAILDMLAVEAIDSVGVWAEVDEQGRNAFMGVCAIGNRKLVKQMLVYSPPLELRDKEGWTALGLMAMSGDSTGVQDLMDAGADVTCKTFDGFYMWESALDAGYGGVSKIIKDKHAGINQAMVAERKAAKEKSRSTTYNTIFEAARAGHSGQLQWFLVTNPGLLHALSEEGYTVLMIVARGGFWLAVDALVRGGAEVDALDTMGWSACMHAAACNQSTTVAYLLSAGADPRIKSKESLTALQLTSCPLVKETLEGALHTLKHGPAPPPSPSSYSPPLSPVSPRPIVLHTRGPNARTARGVVFVETPPSVFSYDNGPEEGEEETTLTLEIKYQSPPSPPSLTPPPPPPSSAMFSSPPKENENLPNKIKLERKAIAPAAAPKKKPAKF